MSPVLILSRLCLKRRFQFLGICEHSSCITARTFLTVSSSISRRRPASAALAAPVDGLQLAISGGKHLLESPERVDDPLHNQLGQTRNASQDPEAARRHGVIEGVELTVVAEELGQPSEVEKILVRQPHEMI